MQEIHRFLCKSKYNFMKFEISHRSNKTSFHRSQKIRLCDGSHATNLEWKGFSNLMNMHKFHQFVEKDQSQSSLSFKWPWFQVITRFPRPVITHSFLVGGFTSCVPYGNIGNKASPRGNRIYMSSVARVSWKYMTVPETEFMKLSLYMLPYICIL